MGTRWICLNEAVLTGNYNLCLKTYLGYSLEPSPEAVLASNHTIYLYTLETHARSLKKWAYTFPIFHAVVLLDSSN